MEIQLCASNPGSSWDVQRLVQTIFRNSVWWIWQKWSWLHLFCIFSMSSIWLPVEANSNSQYTSFLYTSSPIGNHQRVVDFHTYLAEFWNGNFHQSVVSCMISCLCMFFQWQQYLVWIDGFYQIISNLVADGLVHQVLSSSLLLSLPQERCCQSLWCVPMIPGRSDLGMFSSRNTISKCSFWQASTASWPLLTQTTSYPLVSAETERALSAVLFVIGLIFSPFP